MKKILACLLCVSALLPMSGTFAQNDAPTIPRSPRLPVAPDNPAPAHLDGNYLLTLTFTEKDQPGRELAVVVATPSFNTNSAQPIITLNGTLFPQEGGVYLVDYNLGLQAVFSNNGRPVTKDTPSAERWWLAVKGQVAGCTGG